MIQIDVLQIARCGRKVLSHPIAIYRCVVFPTYLVSTRLLGRCIGLVRISRKSKKHRYRYFFLEHVCQVFVFIFF